MNKGQDAPADVQANPPQPEVPQPEAAAENPVKEEPAANANEEDNATYVKAEVGVGSKGSSYAKPTGGPMDIITVPISAGFRTQQRMSFLLIDDAMNKFKAFNDGKAPATHEEFMEKIVQENRIMLPQLPAGQTYIYDPADEQLKVRRPKNP